MEECYPLRPSAGIGPRTKIAIGIEKETIGTIFAIYRVIVHARKMGTSTKEFQP
jgi:hypothetical protein